MAHVTSPHRYNTIQILPYVAGFAEYAGQVRTEILKRVGSDFVIAVDLPSGLEEQILAATRELPTISVVLDQLNRAIPIIPSSAPIEAVRSYLEYGYDLRFIDASLPIPGNMEEFRHLVERCSLFGVENVLRNPDSYGISLEKLFESRYTRMKDEREPVLFSHVPEITLNTTLPEYHPEDASPYLQTRLQYMAMQLQSLQTRGIDVLLVCSHHLVNGILHYMDTEIPWIDDRYVLPTKTCIVAEEEILSVTNEIPYFMYLYELFRDVPVDRKEWIQTLYQEPDCDGLSPDLLASTQNYATRLALTDADIVPDLFNLVAAAKYVVDDTYALKVLEQAITYPPAKNATPNCRFRNIRDFNLDSLSDARTLTLKQNLLDSGGGNTERRRDNSSSSYCGYLRFSRTPESYNNEREFMRYVAARFTSTRPSENEYVAEEYACGLQEGIDLRETLRERHTGRIYVKEPVPENTAAYVLDYRSYIEKKPSQSSENNDVNKLLSLISSPEYSSHFFFDRNYALAGIGIQKGNHYTSQVLLTFANLDVSPTTFFTRISTTNPLASAAKVGLDYARHLFVFTNAPEELENANIDRSRIKVYPCSVIPAPIYDKMREFDVGYWRNDDKAGD